MEELKSTFKDRFTGVWAILAIILFTGLGIHYKTLDWTDYWALWLTMALACGIIALYFYRPTETTGFFAIAGVGVWLLNQLYCWYWGMMTGLPQSNPAYWWYLDYVFYMTAAAEGLFFAVAYFRQDKPLTAFWGGIGAIFHGANPENFGYVATGLMALFSGWKLYEINRLINLGVFPALGVPYSNSAVLWGLGILVMSLGSMWYIRAHANKDESHQDYATYIALIGVLIAAFAALYYGLALSLTGV